MGATLAPPARALQPAELAIIINVDDPASVDTGEYYRTRRQVPAANVIRIHLGSPRQNLAPADFENAQRQVKAATSPAVQAYALAWTLPYRVGCMSISSAFAFGYGTRFCATGCKPTAPNPYFDSASRAPYRDFRMRPTMLLAGTTEGNVRQLIDRGAHSDASRPRGRAYLVITRDAARNTRSPLFPAIRAAFNSIIPIDIIEADGIRNRFDVMFYFTGTTAVPGLDTLGFLPGAVADHLTSAGGQLDGHGQMSALRWLEAGATGSYGSVVEPCNFPQKFPNPGLVLKYYLAGESLIEAYWKSVVWPGQGVFIGEPLAAPFDNRAAAPIGAP
ncbi:MAG: TIGR03790 family protein [Gammaproteobacteria bacterium]|nr:TIGR03790 family protein [Gammaproteobacteria bacterium]